METSWEASLGAGGAIGVATETAAAADDLCVVCHR